MIHQFHSWAYIQRNYIRKDTCTLVSTAELFTMPKTWKQPKCPSTNEWIKKIWCVCVYFTHTMEYYSATKRNNSICNNMEGPRDYHTK